MKSEYTSIKIIPYTFNAVVEDDGVDSEVLHDYITYAFAEEHCIAYHNAYHIIKNLDLFGILIDRYWNKFYKEIGGK